MLQVQPDLRPDCNELIKSSLFQVYSDKLNSLDSVDVTFQKTLKSSSIDKMEIKTITNSLLAQLHLPTADISQLSDMLPHRNYETAHGVHNKGNPLLKTAPMDIDEKVSTTSRKLSRINNNHAAQFIERSRKK